MKFTLWLPIIIIFLNILPPDCWAQKGEPQKPIKLPEVIIIGEDTTILKGEKEKLEPQEIWYGLEKERPSIKEELVLLETTPVSKEVPIEKRPSWIYRNPLTALIMKLLAREKADYKIGLHKFQQGNFREAIKQWQDLLRKYPQGKYRAEALYWSGEAYSSLREPTKALDAFKELIRKYPQHKYISYAFLSSGWIYLAQKDYEEAGKAFSQAIKYTPSSNQSLLSLSYYLKGAALYSAGKFIPASQSFKELREKVETTLLADKAIFWEAECHYNLGDYANAQRLYETYLQSFPSGSLVKMVWYSLGWCQLYTKKYREALTSWDQMEKYSMQNRFKGSVLIGKIRAYLALKELAKAKSLVEEYQSQHTLQDPWLEKAMFEIAIYWIEQRDYPQAMQMLNQILKLYPHASLKPLIIFLLGEGHYQLKQYYKAIEYYRQISSISGNSFKSLQLNQKALLRIGISYYRLAEYQLAAQILEDFLNKFPDSPFLDEANFWLAESRFQQEEFSRALKTYGAISLESKKADYALYGKAWVLYRTEKWAEAAYQFQQVLNKYPHSSLVPEVLFRLGECYFNLKQYPKAETYFQRLLQLFPQSDLKVSALFQLGWINYKEEDYTKARKAFTELLGSYPSSEWGDDAQYWYGMSYFLEKNYSQARHELSKIITNYPQSPYIFRAFMAIGDSYYNEENYAQALQTYRDIINRYPTNPQIIEAEYAMIQTVLQQGQKKQFFSLSQDFLVRHPNHPLSLTLMYQVAEHWLAEGKVADARKIYQEIKERFDKNPEADKALFQLGEIEFRAKNYPAALNYYQSLLKDYPTSTLKPIAQFKIAEINYYLQEYQRAYQGFERFIADFPQHNLISQALYYAGSCLSASGKKDKARAYYQKVTKSFPSDPYTFKSYLELGKILSGQKEFAKAQEWLSKATQAPDKGVRAQAHFFLADIYTATGNYQKGIEGYLKVVYLYSDQEKLLDEALLKAGQNYEQLHRWSEALSIYRKLLKESKDPEKKEIAQKKVIEIQKRIKKKE
jgi:TolA-binding protein